MKSFSNSVRRNFFAGIAVLLPVIVTVWIIWFTIEISDRVIGSMVNDFLFRHFGFSIYGLGLILGLTIILVSGFLSSMFFGKRLLLMIEMLFLRIPFASEIYPSAKKLSEFLFSTDNKGFSKAVLFEYPVPGSYTLGFITNENMPGLNEKTRANLVGIFLPFAPSPFSGIIVFVPFEKVIFLDTTIEQAIKCIVSGGVIGPELEKAVNAHRAGQ